MSADSIHDRLRFTMPAFERALFGLADAPFSTISRADLPAAEQLPISGELRSLGSATAWLHAPPLTAGDLRGKVVLIDFWTYTCINWLRTLPYRRAWADTYQDQGRVAIGVRLRRLSAVLQARAPDVSMRTGSDESARQNESRAHPRGAS
jgi:hypothetical protein